MRSDSVRVGINGDGLLGWSVARAVQAQPDMTLAGIRDVSSGRRARDAERRGFAVYAAPAGRDAAPVPVQARLEDLLAEVDVLVDCTPTPRNLKRCRGAAVKTVVQTDGAPVAPAAPFLAAANYERVVGLQAARVASSDTAALVRTLGALGRAGLLARASGSFGGRWRCGRAHEPRHDAAARRIRAAADLRDAGELVPGVEATLADVDGRDTRCHVHTWRAELTRPATRDEVLDALRAAPRVAVARMCDGILAELMCDLGCLDGQLGDVVVWEDLVAVEGAEACFTCQVFDEGLLVRETIDAVRALAGHVPEGRESMRLTDDALGATPAFLVSPAEREATRRRRAFRLAETPAPATGITAQSASA